MSNIQCGLCRQTFDASEELCGDCREEVDDSWRANLSANLAAAGMAAAIDYLHVHLDDACDDPSCDCWYASMVRTMREAVS